MEGKIPGRFRAAGALPFNFVRGEVLIWAFDSVAYYEDKTRREYLGGSHGMSRKGRSERCTAIEAWNDACDAASPKQPEQENSWCG